MNNQLAARLILKKMASTAPEAGVTVEEIEKKIPSIHTQTLHSPGVDAIATGVGQGYDSTSGGVIGVKINPKKALQNLVNTIQNGAGYTGVLGTGLAAGAGLGAIFGGSGNRGKGAIRGAATGVGAGAGLLAGLKGGEMLANKMQWKNPEIAQILGGLAGAGAGGIIGNKLAGLV